MSAKKNKRRLAEESGLFKFKDKFRNSRDDGQDLTLKAIEEIKQGNGTRCNTFAEYKRKINEP